MTFPPRLAGSHRLARQVSQLGRDLSQALTGLYDLETDALDELGRVAAEYLDGDDGQSGQDRLRRPLSEAVAVAETVRRHRRYDPRHAVLLRTTTRTLAETTTATVMDARDAATTRPDREDMSDLLARLAAVKARLDVADELDELDEQAMEAARRSAEARKSESELSRFFDTYARSEQKAADCLRIFSILVLIGIAVVTSLIFHEHAGDWGIGEYLARLSVTLPLGLLAAYTGRESLHHRQAANWSRQITVKLCTIPLYVAALPELEQDRIRAEFARLIFEGSAVNPPEAGIIDPGIGDLLEKLTGLASAVARSPSTPPVQPSA